MDLQLRLLNQDGSERARSVIEAFAANGQMARFVNELFEEVGEESFQGTLTVEATGVVAAMALELGNLPGRFTTLPVTPLP